MYGPPLTRREVEATLRAKVWRLTARGVDHSAATDMVAESYGIDPQRVSELMEPVDGSAEGSD